ncbi:MAG: long-chain fatty acid--CoA ligase [Bacteroidetes bacterium]|nr:long-chain fatty acid--CoA ligase [Bacteroidota bacterium]
MNTTRTFDFLKRYQEKFGDKEDALAGKKDGKWVKYTSRQYIDYSNNISYGLLALGLKKGDKIATITNNRPEWNFVDMGMAQIGVVHVPLFTTLETSGYEHILNHSEARFVFVSDKTLYTKIKPLVDVIENLEAIYTFNEIDGAKNWTEIVELGKKNAEQYKEEVEKIKSGITPDDFVTLIYTSGTTGNAKGVMLSHKNLVTNAIAAAGVFKLKPDQRYLSILPICHVGERMGNYQTQYSGCSIYYAENLGTIAANMKELSPYGFGAVPRILEKVYDKIIAKGNALTGIKKKLFFWAVDLGLRYKLNGENGWWYEFQLKIADKIIFSKWREALGGNITSIGVGGAALQPRLEKVFWAAGIKLLNMYGLTETSPIITINRSTAPDVRLGTVGALIENVEVKIADDGEILCKGPNVMLGYYKDDESTKKELDADGWFHTGDIGILEDGKFLKITDRKKEIFKLSNGKYVAPQVVENLFKESVFIEQLMVVGESEKFASALIVPNFEALREWCTANNISSGNKEEMVKHEDVVSHYQTVVKDLNKSLDKDEQIKRFKLISDEWSPDSGELSPTLKLKRRVINAKYEDMIKQIYRHDS